MSQSRPTDAQATAYAESYVLYGDQSRAFRVAFPGSKAKAEAVHARASTLHRVGKVQVRIEELNEMAKKQAEEKFCITTESLQRTLSEVMDAGLKSKKVVRTDEEGNEYIDDTETAQNLSAVVSAVSEVNKMNGNHAATRLALGGDPENPMQVVTMSPEQYKQARKEALESDDC